MPHQTRSWKAILDSLKRRRLEEIYQRPSVSHEEYVDGLNYLRRLYPDAALQKGAGIDVVSDALLDVVLGPLEMIGMYPRSVMGTVRMLRKIQHIEGFNLFARRFPSHYGMWNQLAATAYLASYLNVVAIERKIGKQDVDAVAEVDGESLLFHIKSLDQRAKTDAQFHAQVQISNALRDHPGRTPGQRLEPAEMVGVVPTVFVERGWQDAVFSWPYEAKRHEWVDANGSVFAVQLQAVPDDGNSFTAHAHGVNPFCNLGDHLAKVEDRIPEPARARNVLVGVVGFPASADVASIGPIEPADSLKIDASMFLAASALGDPVVQIARSPVHPRPASTQLAENLQAGLPAKVTI